MSAANHHHQRRRTELDRRRQRKRANTDAKGPAQTPRRPLRNRHWRRLNALKAERGPEAKAERRANVVKWNAYWARHRAAVRIAEFAAEADAKAARVEAAAKAVAEDPNPPQRG